MKLNRKLLLVAGIITSLAGEAGAAGSYVSKTTAAVYLSSGPGWTYVTSVYVPPGTWVVQALSPAVNFGGTDILRCSIWANGTLQTSTAAMMGGGGGMPAALGVQNLAVISLGSYTSVYLYCGHDGAVTGQRIDSSAALVLTRAPAN